MRGNQARVKNADLRHPCCTVVKTQICVTGPQCVNTPIPAAARSEVWVGGRSLPGTAGSIPAGGMYSAIGDVKVVTWRVEGFLFPLGLYF